MKQELYVVGLMLTTRSPLLEAHGLAVGDVTLAGSGWDGLTSNQQICVDAQPVDLPSAVETIQKLEEKIERQQQTISKLRKST